MEGSGGSDADEIAVTGAELWRRFVSDAGLQPDSSYDGMILATVGKELEVSSDADVPVGGEDLAARIEAKEECTATDVLVAVIGAMAPWSRMLKDLLELMRACGAKRTQTQLRARVDIAAASERLDLDLEAFAEEPESLDLDLEAFADAAAGYDRLRRDASTRGRLWSAGDLMELLRVLPARDDCPGVSALPDDVERWLVDYRTADAPGWGPPDVPWPPPPAPPVASGDDELDSAIAAAHHAWVAAVARTAALAPTRRALNESPPDDDRATDVDRDLPRGPDAWPARVLWTMDSDQWAATVLERLHVLAAHVAGGGWEWHGRWSGPMSPRALIDLVGSLPVGTASYEDLAALERLLSLPVWRKRYDLYANWVFTQIVDALADVRPRIHSDDGRLDFAFRATRMADVVTPVGALAVYSELGSPLAGPSVKRKRAVQPDYSLLVGDEDDPARSSILEIECKQYQQADPGNFGPALHDYALARPHAKMVVVSYGQVSDRSRETTLAKVAPEARDRCSVIGSLQPGEKAALEELRSSVRAAVDARLPGMFDLIDLSRGGRIEMHWDRGSARDLDIHLHIDTGAIYDIDFEHHNRERMSPHAWLVEDVRTGPGPEVVEIGEWLPGSYRIRVHDFAGGDVSRSSPRVVVFGTSGDERRFTCSAGIGEWWDVAEIDTLTGRVTAL